MMALGLGQLADFVGKGQRINKIGERKYPFKAVDTIYFDDMPCWNLRAIFGKFRLRHRWLASATGNTLHLTELRHFIMLLLIYSLELSNIISQPLIASPHINMLLYDNKWTRLDEETICCRRNRMSLFYLARKMPKKPA